MITDARDTPKTAKSASGVPIRHQAHILAGEDGCDYQAVSYSSNLTYRPLNLIPLTRLPVRSRLTTLSMSCAHASTHPNRWFQSTYNTIVQAFCVIGPFVLPPRLVISFRGYHSQI